MGPDRGLKQVENSAGGYAWAVDDWTRLHRFLILGSEGGTYYAERAEADARERQGGRRCIAADGARRSRELVEVASGPRAEERSGAVRARDGRELGDEPTRRAALAALPRVARIGTHLFHFAAVIKGSGAGAAAMRRRSARWYTTKPVEALAFQAIKYRSATAGRTATSCGSRTRRGAQRRQPDTGSVKADHARLYEWIIRAGGTASWRRSGRASSGPRRRRPGRSGRAHPRVRPAARGVPTET